MPLNTWPKCNPLLTLHNGCATVVSKRSTLTRRLFCHFKQRYVIVVKFVSLWTSTDVIEQNVVL